MAAKEESFLEKLTQAFNALEMQSSVKTSDFTHAIDELFPVFDHLGIITFGATTAWQCISSRWEPV